MLVEKKPRALIIGGSLGGLFAANSLLQSGWDVDVFERSPSALDSRGGGIVLQPQVVAAINNAGLGSASPLGVLSQERVYLDRHGEVLQSAFMPQTQTSWNTLYRRLVRGIPSERYHRGQRLTSFSQDGERITARFEAGAIAEGDLLVGADGPDSTVRSILLPETSLSYSGYVVWRGLVPERSVSPETAAALTDKFVFQHDPESLMLQYLVPGEDGSTNPGERRFNWLWYLKAAKGETLDAVLTDRQGVHRRHSVPPGMLAPAQERVFRDYAEANVNPAFRELVEKTHEIFVQAIVDLAVPQMVFGRAILLGDAAFVPRPHTAGSTSKAAENALSLGAALRASPTDIDMALRLWESDQLNVGRQMIEWGVRMGDRLMRAAA
ncbi:FAD binding domain-containing protein [Paraburkholderia sp. J7]|uniref:FAD binding domain-containing protein n=1 Tax=Paraburkholderia sp. J7 TaxID=2805438 RepID=UPI002AB7EBA3|nr:FAD binding domain-containing protein [Paraburkholderia sp. J7]